MTAFPLGSKDAVKLYIRVSKLNPRILLEKVEAEPHDIVSISAEGRKQQILAQTRDEVLERIINAV